MPLITSSTVLKSLKYSDFDQSSGQPSIPSSDLKPFKNTGAQIGRDMTPDTKKGLGFLVERRKEDAIRLGKTMDPRSSPSAQRFLINQTLVNQSVALNEALKGNLKEAGTSAAIGAARVAGVAASAIAQAAGSGTGLRVLQGFVPLNGGYLTQGSLARAAFAPLNPFSTADNQISKGTIALRGKTINDGFVGSKEFDRFLVEQDLEEIRRQRDSQPLSSGSFSTTKYLSSSIVKADIQGKIGKFVTGSLFDQSVKTRYVLNDTIGNESKEAIKNESYSQIGFLGPEKYLQADTGVPVKDTGGRRERRLNRKKIDTGNLNSLDSKFYLRDATNKIIDRDRINFLSIQTTELENNDPSDIIPFAIHNLPASGSEEYLYFRAYLESLGDNFSGEWNGTRYLGRAEELYNYTGFKRTLQFSFKVAAHSQAELKPLYEKLNRLAGTTAPTYQNGLFMQGVFSKLTIGDYVQKLPGFFTSVDLTWQTAYPWEIGNVDNGSALNNTPRVPHILDVSVNFQPIHDFAPQYGKDFIVNTPVT